MPNRHQIQKDFYTKQREWKDKYKVEGKDAQKLQLRPTISASKELPCGDREI